MTNFSDNLTDYGERRRTKPTPLEVVLGVGLAAIGMLLFVIFPALESVVP